MSPSVSEEKSGSRKQTPEQSPTARRCHSCSLAGLPNSQNRTRTFHERPSNPTPSPLQAKTPKLRKVRDVPPERQAPGGPQVCTVLTLYTCLFCTWVASRCLPRRVAPSLCPLSVFSVEGCDIISVHRDSFSSSWHRAPETRVIS